MKNRMDYGLSGVEKKSVVLIFVLGFVLFFCHGDVRIAAKVIRITRQEY